MPKYKCCICGREFSDFGNNPWPVFIKGLCCNTCNEEIVVPARIEAMLSESVNPKLPQCVTGRSGSGVCGNRDCIERQGIGCCAACQHREDCNSACGWLEDLNEKELR